MCIRDRNKIMSALTVNNVRVAGLSACVPEKVEENLTLSIFENEEEAKKIIAVSYTHLDVYKRQFQCRCSRR